MSLIESDHTRRPPLFLFKHYISISIGSGGPRRRSWEKNVFFSLLSTLCFIFQCTCANIYKWIHSRASAWLLEYMHESPTSQTFHVDRVSACFTQTHYIYKFFISYFLFVLCIRCKNTWFKRLYKHIFIATIIFWLLFYLFYRIFYLNATYWLVN